MHRDHAGRLAHCLGLLPVGKYAIKGRLIHVTQPVFVFRAACSELFGVIWRYFVLSVRSIVGTTAFEGDCDVGSFLSP
jgi:hypothetical protein